MTLLLKVYEDCKYCYECGDKVKEIEYTDVKHFTMVSDLHIVQAIEADTDGSCIDPHHEYLMIFFENGSVSTFRNSHVDVFACRK